MPTTNAKIRRAFNDDRIVKRRSDDPQNPSDGAMWYRTDLDEFRGQVAGETVTFDTAAI